MNEVLLGTDTSGQLHPLNNPTQQANLAATQHCAKQEVSPTPSATSPPGTPRHKARTEPGSHTHTRASTWAVQLHPQHDSNNFGQSHPLNNSTITRAIGQSHPLNKSHTPGSRTRITSHAATGRWYCNVSKAFWELIDGCAHKHAQEAQVSLHQETPPHRHHPSSQTGTQARVQQASNRCDSPHHKPTHTETPSLTHLREKKPLRCMQHNHARRTPPARRLMLTQRLPVGNNAVRKRGFV